MQKLLVGGMKFFIVLERHGSTYQRKLLADRMKTFYYSAGAVVYVI